MEFRDLFSRCSGEKAPRIEVMRDGRYLNVSDITQMSSEDLKSCQINIFGRPVRLLDRDTFSWGSCALSVGYDPGPAMRFLEHTYTVCKAALTGI